MFTFRQILGARAATAPTRAVDRATAVGLAGRAGLALALALGVAACGQKGPLTLPDPAARATTPATPQPTPAGSSVAR